MPNTFRKSWRWLLQDLADLVDLLVDALEAHRAERRHAEHRAIFRSRGRDGTFTLMVEQALQGSGRAIDRQRELLAHGGD